jgi:hypothetical protein
VQAGPWQPTPGAVSRSDLGLRQRGRSVSRVLSRADAEASLGDGHPSEAAGHPTAHAADPRAGQRASPPAGGPARVAPSYLALLRVEFARFTPTPGQGRASASSLWHWSSSCDGRVLPATLRCGARTFLTTRRGHPFGAAQPSDRLADLTILLAAGSTPTRSDRVAAWTRSRCGPSCGRRSDGRSRRHP